METVVVKGREADSRIVCGERMANLAAYLPQGARTVIITDENVVRHLPDPIRHYPRIVIGTGEAVKTPDTVARIFRELIAAEADRSVFIVGIGGGIVCDVAGFVAATYMRGVRFGFVATSLLAQVDASVGGKNGVNVDGYKNIMGTFTQPEFVLCDIGALDSLPDEELRCGFAEIVKHMLIADEPMLGFLEENLDKALARDADVLATLVAHSVRIKAGVVTRDERESGERKLLNFGHTLGHALEKLGLEHHGRAVSAGMAVAARMSAARGMISPDDVRRIEAVLRRLGLPTRPAYPAADILPAMRKDKKRAGEGIHYILLERVGKAVVETIGFAELEQAVRDALRDTTS